MRKEFTEHAEKIANYYKKAINSDAEKKDEILSEKPFKVKRKEIKNPFLKLIRNIESGYFPFSALWMRDNDGQLLLIIKGGKPERLGKGSFATVKQAIVFELRYFKNQYLLIKRTDHPYVIHSSFDREDISLSDLLHGKGFILNFAECEIAKKTTRYYQLTEQKIPLSRFLKDKPNLPKEKLFSIALDIIINLYLLHEEDIAHKDIKPDNALIDDKGVARLCDFDFAKKNAIPPEKDSMFGTPEYIFSKKTYYSTFLMDHDVFALAITLRGSIFPSSKKIGISNAFSLFLQSACNEDHYTCDDVENRITLKVLLGLVLLESLGKLQYFIEQENSRSDKHSKIHDIALNFMTEFKKNQDKDKMEMVKNACAFFRREPSGESMTTEASSASQPSTPTQQNPCP